MNAKFFCISEADMLKAKKAVNATCFAKVLLESAFSDDAILSCTVSGGEYRAGGKANIVKKDALDCDAIAVIIGKTYIASLVPSTSC